MYGDKCLGILAQVLPPKGYGEQYTDNICILGKAGDAYLDIGGLPMGSKEKCLDATAAAKQAFADGLRVSNNTVCPRGCGTVTTVAGVRGERARALRARTSAST